jgi:hypothetical protein
MFDVIRKKFSNDLKAFPVWNRTRIFSVSFLKRRGSLPDSLIMKNNFYSSVSSRKSHSIHFYDLKYHEN